MLAGFIAGGVGGGIGSLSYDGLLSGAVSGALFAWIGQATTNFHTLGKMAAHASAGGVVSHLQGAKFGHGFVAAGGALSKTTGRSFKNGFMTSAFQYVFNQAAPDLPTEPENIRYYMRKNEAWADKITITEGDNWTTIKIYLTVSYDLVIPSDGVEDYIASIERFWNSTVSENGSAYRITVKLENIGSNGLLGHPQGDLNISRYTNCRSAGADGMAYVGYSTVHRYHSARSASTAAHKFWHALGFYHQPKDTESIMSYAFQGSIRAWEAEQIRKIYGK